MRTESPAEVVAVLNRALEGRPEAIKAAAQLTESVSATAAHLQVVVLTDACPESRLIADVVTRLMTGQGLPKSAICSTMNRTQASWPALSRAPGARSVALLEDGETVGASLVTAWLRKLARDDHDRATVFIELAGARAAHAALIDDLQVLAREHKPLIELHVIDLAVSDKRARH